MFLKCTAVNKTQNLKNYLSGQNCSNLIISRVWLSIYDLVFSVLVFYGTTGGQIHLQHEDIVKDRRESEISSDSWAFRADLKCRVLRGSQICVWVITQHMFDSHSSVSLFCNMRKLSYFS